MKQQRSSGVSVKNRMIMSQQDQNLLRPIVVGYAFGHKKMATMSLVMAEASRALSTVAVITSDGGQPPARSNSHNGSDDLSTIEIKSQSGTSETSTVTTAYSQGETKHKMAGDRNRHVFINRQGSEIDDTLPQDDEHRHFKLLVEEEEQEDQEEQEEEDLEDCSIHSSGISWTRDSPNRSQPESLDEFNFLAQNISHIHKPASAKSAYNMEDLCTEGSSQYASTSSSQSISSAFEINRDFDASTSIPTSHQYHRINISFVPLDLDSPLDEQHGGKFDVILHKMTEDILATTFHTPRSPLSMEIDESRSSGIMEEDVDPAAIQRVLRLIQYQGNHPESFMMDHPLKIKQVMSRFNISNILSQCLVGIVSRSGLPVSTPRYLLIHSPNTSTVSHEPISTLNYPLIAKPVAAAGTKQSHKMVIVLRRHGLYKIPLPCLIQEYINHDSILYKVYVLGDLVFVYPRTSLPNLFTTDRDASPPYVEFDSQESYPTMRDFSPFNAGINTQQDPCDHPTPVITSQELQPIADALRDAFGLQLFGFDVLLTDKRDGQGKELLVVDVNYFPSYKEVGDFAPRLARYLAQIAIQNRMKHLNMP